MVNGVSIGIEEFKKVNKSDRDVIMFENLLHIRNKLDESQVKLDRHQKSDYMFYAGISSTLLIISFLLGEKLGWINLPFIN